MQTPDQQLVADWNKKFQACASARKPFEKQWYTNLAFYFGRQYVEWLKSSSNTNLTMMIPQAPSYRVRLVSNRLKPIVRKEISKLSQEKPQFYVIPSSTDDEDIAKARAGESVADSIISTTNFNRKRRQATFWTVVCGTGFIQTWMSPGDEDVSIDAVTPYHLWIPNLEEPELEKQPYVIHGLTLSVSEVKSMYDVDVEADSNSNSPESKFMQALRLQDKTKEKDQVFVKEFWVKPCSEFPVGAMFVIANDKLVYMHEPQDEFEIDPETESELLDGDGEKVAKEFPGSNILGGNSPRSSYPYSHGKFPFTKIDHIPTGGFYSESVIVDVIPLQKEYNRSRSQGIEARNLTAKPQWTYVQGSLDPNKLVAKPGLAIPYMPGFNPPAPVRNPELPSYVMALEERCIQDIDEISGKFDVNRGAPAGIEAASAIAYLQEESDSVLTPTVSSIEEAVADVGYKALCLARDYYPEDKIIKVTSGTMLYETMLFKSQALDTEIDFRVEAGSMAPRSRAAKQAFITELLKLGAIPPLDALKYMEMSATNKMYDDLQVDARQAERENFKLKNGLPVPINSYDNHTAHIITHERYMKSQQFETLEDEQKQVFLKHHAEHLQTFGQEQVDAEEFNNPPKEGAPTNA